MLSSIPLASGMVMSGQKIIDRGEVITDNTYRVLCSFDKEMKRRSSTADEITTTIIGQILFVFILVIMFTSYLSLFRKDYFDKPRSITMLYAMITLFPIFVSLIMSHNFFSVYIIPFAMTPIFVRVFMDSRTAFITHVTMILICAAAVKYQYEFIMYSWLPVWLPSIRYANFPSVLRYSSQPCWLPLPVAWYTLHFS